MFVLIDFYITGLCLLATISINRVLSHWFKYRNISYFQHTDIKSRTGKKVKIRKIAKETKENIMEILNAYFPEILSMAKFVFCITSVNVKSVQSDVNVKSV